LLIVIPSSAVSLDGSEEGRPMWAGQTERTRRSVSINDYEVTELYTAGK